MCILMRKKAFYTPKYASKNDTKVSELSMGMRTIGTHGTFSSTCHLMHKVTRKKASACKLVKCICVIYNASFLAV